MTRQVIAIDTETALIRQGLLAPPLVCVSRYFGSGDARLLRYDEAKGDIAADFEAAANGEALITGQNFAYDAAVFMAQWPDLIPLIIAAYDADGIADTMLDEKLIDLAHGRLGYHENEEGKKKRVSYSLDAIGQRYGLEALDKGADGWRTRYAELRPVPIKSWPERAVRYAKDDAVSTFNVHELQRAQWDRNLYPDLFHDSPAQARAALALHLMSSWGMRTDPHAVFDLQNKLEGERDRYYKILSDAGALNKAGGIAQATMRDRVSAILGDDAPTTPTGRVSLAAETVNAISMAPDLHTDPILDAYTRFKKIDKKLGTYVNKLWKGTEHPIQPRVNSLLETGRTSMAGWTGMPRGFKGFSLQTVPRSGGIRECFIPRSGYEFVGTDYSVAELRSLGQVLWNMNEAGMIAGGRQFAELFRKDPNADPHAYFAAGMVGITPGEAMRLAAEGKASGGWKPRQDAKAGNFGFPGGMGVARFVQNERKKYFESEGEQGGLYSFEEAHALREGYVSTWDMQPYFSWVGEQCGFGPGNFQTWVSKRYRGGCGFSDGANNGFQAMTADGAKRACWLLVKEMLIGRLRGCRLVNFIHDETLIEAPKGGAADAAPLIATIMVDAMQEYTTDVPAIAEPEVMQRWRK